MPNPEKGEILWVGTIHPAPFHQMILFGNWGIRDGRLPRLEMPMSAHAITLHLEAPLYDYFRQRAENKHRTLEAELLETVEAAGPKAQALPTALARAVAELPGLDDQALWRVARDHLPRQAAAELEALNLKQQREALNTGEEEALDRLIEAYERFLLLRAEAASLLHRRGHDVSELIDPG